MHIQRAFDVILCRGRSISVATLPAGSNEQKMAD
jgi:hypothetical protein